MIPFRLPAARTLALIIGLLVLASLAFAIPSCLAERRNKAAQTRVNTGQAAAGATTGEVSLNTLEGVVANDMATQDTVSNGVAATRSAPEGQRDAAGINALCQFKAAKNKPECRK